MTQGTADIRRMRRALEKAKHELAALVPNPNKPVEDDWPCDNPADRECLQLAYEHITEALAEGEAE